MRLVEEEDQPRLVRIADLGKLLEEFGEQPQQEGGVEPRIHHQLVGGQHRDRAAPVIGGAHDVGDRKRRLAEEIFRALLFEDQQAALQRADRRFRDLPELARQLACMLAHVVQERLQILQVEQRQAALVGDLEGDVQHAFLRFRCIHQPGEQKRPHLGDGGAHAVPLFAIEVPEDHREFLIGEVVKADLLGPLVDPVFRLAHDGDAGEVALDVGAEHRHAGIGEALGQHLQRHCLAGAGRPGDNAVAVAVFQLEIFALVEAVVGIAAGADIELSVFEHAPRPSRGMPWSAGGLPLFNETSYCSYKDSVEHNNSPDRAVSRDGECRGARDMGA